MAYSNGVQEYMNNVGDESNLFYGRAHRPRLVGYWGPYVTYLLPKGDRVLNEKNRQELKLADFYSEGEIIYNGVIYPKVTMLLDLYRDELIVVSTKSKYHIALDPVHLGFAEVHGQHVFYLPPDSRKNAPQPGHYLLLHKDDNCSVIKKEIFNFSNPTNLTNYMLTNYVMTKNIKFYILKDNIYYNVKSKGSVVNIFNSKKKELDKFVKENNLNFDNDDNRENSIIAIVKQYEKLNKQ